MNPLSAPLSVRSVVMRFGDVTALDGISLELEPGEFFGLLGPNGAGKSTLMSLVAGLQTPESGEARIGGFPARSPDARGALGFVPQELALYPELTARENLEVFGGLQGLKGSALRERTAEMLLGVQLSDRQNSVVKTFSGGMMRRLNIAAALMHRPRLLLCDEPTVGVDPQSRNAIFDLLQSQNRDGTTVVYSTHYMEEAARLCSRIGIIDRGHILALGTLNELLQTLPFDEEIHFPAAAETASLRAELAENGDLTTEDGLHRFRPRAGFRLSAFYQAIERHCLPTRLFAPQRPTLEAVFLNATGRTLRE